MNINGNCGYESPLAISIEPPIDSFFGISIPLVAVALLVAAHIAVAMNYVAGVVAGFVVAAWVVPIVFNSGIMPIKE